MADILLIEPNYKNKYPPLGLMKIAYFHKNIHNDFVRFAKGRLPEAMDGKKWDRVYVTTLFTFEWEETKKSIEYALRVVKDKTQVYIGGIMSTLMPELFAEHFPTVKNNIGLLDRVGTLGLKHEECIDRLPPDYSILEDIKDEYVYPWHDGYFLYMTRGCGMKCQFCAVQTLEPNYIPYISIKEQVAIIDKVSGPKRDLLLMDNNVLRSTQFDKIIDEIKELGFAKGAKFRNPKTGSLVNRYVDFNQGLDAKLMTEHKAKRLGEISLRPARIAFDHIEDVEYYKKALELCAKNGIKYLSNYILFNGEEFTGKGSSYHADTPEDLYNRMKISMDFCDELNAKYGQDGRIHIFSFPMKYVPLQDLNRSYIGTNWNGKYLRAIQRMLIPTQGKGVNSRSFFEADFGKNVDEFVENLAMPEELLGLRGHFVERKSDSKEERELRYKRWLINHARIDEWRRLYRQLCGDDKEKFLKIIGNNDFSIDNYKNCSTALQKKLFIFNMSNLSILRNFDKFDADTLTYIIDDFSVFYDELIRYLVVSKSLQFSCLKGALKMKGIEFIRDIIKTYIKNGELETNVFEALYKAQKSLKINIVDTRLIDIAIKFRQVNVFKKKQFEELILSILLDMDTLHSALLKNLNKFKKTLYSVNEKEVAFEMIQEKIDGTINKIEKILKIQVN